jgi:hypothetical protein
VDHFVARRRLLPAGGSAETGRQRGRRRGVLQPRGPHL